jgi:hypothetical protein
MTVSMAPLAPTIAANGETPAAGPAKVSFRRALSH